MFNWHGTCHSVLLYNLYIRSLLLLSLSYSSLLATGLHTPFMVRDALEPVNLNNSNQDQ